MKVSDFVAAGPPLVVLGARRAEQAVAARRAPPVRPAPRSLRRVM
jgi:hypothetical protein